MLPGHFCNRFAVGVVQILGHDAFVDEALIAFLAGALDAAAADADGQLTVEVGDFDFVAQNRFVEADGYVEINVQILAPEIRMRSDAGDDVEIAGLAVGLLALALHADAGAILHTGWDIDLKCLKAAIAVQLELHLRTAGGLFEGQCHRMFDISAALGCWPAAGAAASAASCATRACASAA